MHLDVSGFSCRFIGIGFATGRAMYEPEDSGFQLQIYWDRLCNWENVRNERNREGFSCRFIGIGFATAQVRYFRRISTFQLQVYWDRLCNRQR